MNNRCKYRTFDRHNKTPMIRFRSITGFVLLVLAGMVFAGLRLGPEEELPPMPLVVLLSALGGGLVQFSAAVLSVARIEPQRLRRWVIGALAVFLAAVAVPSIAAFGAIFGGTVHIGTVVTVLVAAAIAIALGVTARTPR
jgi:hypothetical protein